MSYPRTPEAIAALPYRLSYGHWGMSAWTPDKCWGIPGEMLAYVAFPVSTRGPFDPPEVQDRVFVELDGAARAALATRGA